MKRFAIVAALVSLSASVPAVAQQNGLVNVDVSNVLNDLDILNGSLNNNTVQVPISVAAAVCGVAVNVLASSKNRGTVCTVKQENVTQALKRAAQRQAKKDAKAQ